MYILVAIIFVIVGVFMTVLPRKVYNITQSWKNNSEAEPSQAYIVTTRLAGVAFFILAIVSIALFINKMGSNSEIGRNNEKLKQAVLSTNSSTVTLNEIVPFEWDVVYTFSPYTSKEDIEAIVGIKSNAIQQTVNEGMVQLIFVKDQKIISSVCGYSDSLGYSISFLEDTVENYRSIYFTEKAEFSVTRNNDIVELTYIK